MRKSLLATVAALSLAGGVAVAHAQSAPPPPAPPPPGPTAQAPMPPPPPGAWMHRRGWWHDRMMRNRAFMPGTFALFFNRGDRQLTPSDVQTIAQALLFWNGNHTWKVVDVAPGPDDTVQFSYVAPDNTLIARFAMNTHTGRLSRIG